MPKLKIVKDDNGKYVIVTAPKAGQIEDKERFIAVKPNRCFIVSDFASEAESFLSDTGGKIYRLTYYIHNGSDGEEQLPMSNFYKEVKGGKNLLHGGNG